jgi:hypothetical protein
VIIPIEGVHGNALGVHAADAAKQRTIDCERQQPKAIL